MLFQGRVYRLFYYIPGIIVLFLSMFALYSAAQLMESRRTVRERYQYYASAFIEMEEAMQAFEKKLLDYVSGEPGATFSIVKNEFKALNDRFVDLQNGRTTQVQKTEKNPLNFEVTLYRVNMEMAHLADALNEYEQSFKKSDKRDRMMYVQHERIEVIRNDVSKLQDTIIRGFVYAMFDGQIKYKEGWLYWLIFVMGFCGFVLLIMNSNKLKELEKVHAEKKESVELLEERLAALEAATDGIFIVDAKGKMTYMNGAFYSIISDGPYSPESERRRKSLFGKSWRDVFSPSDVEVLEEDVLPALKKRGVWGGAFQIFKHEKAGIWTDMSLTQLPEGGVIGTVQDVSYKRKAEKEKRDLEEQFYQAQKMEAIGRLAGGIAHDFNNILAAMNGYAEFLLDDLKKGSEQHKFAENILKAGRQARSLVDKMLAFSRRGSSEQDIVDVRQALDEVVGMISISLPKTIELETDITSDPLYVSGNLTQLSQMIMNLCVNAQDAIENDRGKLFISLGVENTETLGISGIFRDEFPNPYETPYMRIDDVEAGHACMVIGHLAREYCYAKMSIQDTGTGISHAIMEHIFEPFFTTKPVGKGTGLGLATVHGVLAAHRAFMIIDSKLGVGTHFDVYFPLLIEEQENKVIIEDCRGRKKLAREGLSVQEQDFETPEDHEKADKIQKKKSNYHILIVEDQEDVRSMITTMIKRFGHKVSTANSGMEGLDVIRENPDMYDLVITDYNMPKMSGLEMVHQASLDIPDLRFVLLSGYSLEKMGDLIKGLPSFKAVLHKPVSKKQLEEVIQEAINT
jgi:PAS domain S-box-containing protein